MSTNSRFKFGSTDGSHLIESAQLALADGDLPGAVAHLQQAVAVAPNPPARQLLGGLLFYKDDLTGARREWELAFREWKVAGEPRAAAIVAAALADLHAAGFGNRIVGKGWVSRARRLLEREGRCVEQGYVEVAVVACAVDDVDELEQAAGRALELAREFNDAALEVRALADSGYALVVQGRITDGFARLDEAMAALSAGEVKDPAVAGMSYCALLSACDRAGDVARAEEWTRVLNGLEPMLVDGQRRAIFRTHCHLAYGSVLCNAGRWAEGEAQLLQSLGPGSSVYLEHRADAAARLASLRLLQGRVEEAAELLRTFEDRPGSCEPLARVHFANGELDLASAVARRGIECCGGDRLRAAALRSLLVDIELARDDVAAAADHAGALRDLAGSTDSRLMRAEAALADGRVAAARSQPELAIENFESARASLHPNERPVLAGMLGLALAQVLAETDDRGAAIDHARAALAVFERLGAPIFVVDRTDALLRSLGARARSSTRSPAVSVASLTTREHQVLDLVRLGLTNAEIGARLFISAKTAEHHVGRVLAKLGARSRAEAAAVAAATQLTSDAP